MGKERIFSAEDARTDYGIDKITSQIFDTLGKAERTQQLFYCDVMQQQFNVTELVDDLRAYYEAEFPDAHPKFIDARIGTAVNEMIQDKRIANAKHHDLSNIVTAGAIEELSILTDTLHQEGKENPLKSTVTYIHAGKGDAPTADDLIKIDVAFKGKTASSSMPAILLKDHAQYFQRAQEGIIERQTLAEHEQQIDLFLASDAGQEVKLTQTLHTMDQVEEELATLRSDLQMWPMLVNEKTAQTSLDYMTTRYIQTEHLPDHIRAEAEAQVQAAIAQSQEQAKTMEPASRSEAVIELDKRAGLDVA